MPPLTDQFAGYSDPAGTAAAVGTHIGGSQDKSNASTARSAAVPPPLQRAVPL
ncbi:hypothetical protein ABZX85_33955 [Streptomyces sp. NPDC004539]|uniref:hypothetical protein n=1 Tax=Streptomyces sp. NPDC004539 TaxID=3154280 RepID=UPI0033BAA042